MQKIDKLLTDTHYILVTDRSGSMFGKGEEALIPCLQKIVKLIMKKDM